jgi:nucleoside-diphosphate-sugar epimerase
VACADITKSRQYLGYAPGVKIEQGIPLFVNWFKKQ